MILILLVLCCACAGWFLRKWRLDRLTASVPELPGGLPFIGHAHRLNGKSGNLWDVLQSLQTDTINGGGIMKGWLGPKLGFIVTDPKLAQSFLNTFEDKPYYYDFGKSWVDTGLITSDVPYPHYVLVVRNGVRESDSQLPKLFIPFLASTWRRHRKLLNSTFNQRILDGFLEVFNALSAQLVTKVEKELGKEQFDIFPYLNDLAMENVFQTAFGFQTQQKCSDEYKDAAAKMLEIICSRLNNIFMHSSFLYNWTKTKREEEKCVNILKKASFDVLRTKKAELNENKETKTFGHSMKGFLDCLLELQSEGLLTDKEITEEVDTMIEAGSDTTARGLLFTLILLASHSDAQDRVHAEIQEVLIESSCDVTKNHLSRLVYMEAVIKESLRLYTIVPVIGRKVTRDHKQDDFVLPSGSEIFVFLSGINRNADWGQDVDTFNPDRWLDGSLPDFASFSFGRRSCLGRTYAMMSMKTTLVHFLRRYRVHRRETQLKLKYDFMLLPAEGHYISVELRQ